MILTEKAKCNFEHFLYTKYDGCQIKPEEEIYWQHFSNELTLFDIYEKLPEVLKNALIIEFFDSVGIHFNRGLSFIKSKPHKCEVYIRDYDKILGQCFDFKGKFLSHSESEATTEAIKKANEIYNSL